MLTMPTTTPKPHKLYALGSRDVRASTLKLVDEIDTMLKRGYSRESIGRAIETCITKALNEERKEVAALARELGIDSNHVEIRAACSRGGPSFAADAAVNVCRDAFARLCAERIATSG